MFWLARIAQEAAKAHCDKHIVKMPLEATQLLYTAQWLRHGDDESWRDAAPLTKTGSRGYGVTHKNHPVALWVRQSPQHYERACVLGLALCREYSERYGRRHACEDHLEFLRENPPPFEPHEGQLDLPPPQCMPEEFRVADSASSSSWDAVIQAYRAYYLGSKADIAKWAHSEPPQWWVKQPTKARRTRQAATVEAPAQPPRKRVRRS